MIKRDIKNNGEKLDGHLENCGKTTGVMFKKFEKADKQIDKNTDHRNYMSGFSKGISVIMFVTVIISIAAYFRGA